ncbi:hypothetical protein ACI2JA_08050 [Alkalihalobacillus sp. NPDC078783]
MAIAIYDYNDSKIPLILKLSEETCLSEMLGHYFFDTDWQHGPNIFIDFEHKDLEEKIFHEVKECVNNYVMEHNLSEETVERKRELYLKKQEKLMQLEFRKQSQSITMHDHGDVKIRDSKTGLYNSSFHYNMFKRYRYDLNPIYLNILKEFRNLSEVEKAHLFLDKFRFIATLFEEGPSRGCLSFLSHAQGFFSNIEARGYESKIKETFENRRYALYKNYKPEIKGKVENPLKEWQKKWLVIKDEMNNIFDISNYEDAERLGLKDQLELLKRELKPLANEFHGDLLKMDEKELEEFILSKRMLVFRDIVNLFYLSLPLFEQSMAKKQFYAYSVVRYYEETLDEELLYTIK